MYETWQLLTAYFVGTAGGMILFRQFIKEKLIAGALDSLVEQDYIRSYVDDEGITQLYKWYELEDVIEEINRKRQVRELIQEAVEIQEQLWEDNDDSA